jgi:hypothetical protein
VTLERVGSGVVEVRLGVEVTPRVIGLREGVLWEEIEPRDEEELEIERLEERLTLLREEELPIEERLPTELPTEERLPAELEEVRPPRWARAALSRTRPEARVRTSSRRTERCFTGDLGGFESGGRLLPRKRRASLSGPHLNPAAPLAGVESPISGSGVALEGEGDAGP